MSFGGTWRDVYGEDPSWDDVASRLSGYGLGQVLATLGGVSAILNSSAPVEGQRRIIAKLFEFPDRVGRDFQAWWDSEKPGGLTDFPLFFTEPQVVAAAKIALLACPPVTQTRASSLDPLGESLLMIGDLLDREDAGDLPSVIGTPADRIPWLRYLVTNGLFNASDNLAHALARTHDLYLTDRPELGDEPGHIDLPRRFRETTGLDPELAWTLGACLFGNWRTVDPKSDRPPGPLSLEAFSSSFRLTKQEADAFADYLLLDAAAARTQLRDLGVGPDALRVYDPLPLASKPLVRLEGRVYCPSVRLLRWKLASGLHHAFLAPERTRASDRQAYLTYTMRRNSSTGRSRRSKPGLCATRFSPSGCRATCHSSSRSTPSRSRPSSTKSSRRRSRRAARSGMQRRSPFRPSRYPSWNCWRHPSPRAGA